MANILTEERINAAGVHDLVLAAIEAASKRRVALETVVQEVWDRDHARLSEGALDELARDGFAARVGSAWKRARVNRTDVSGQPKIVVGRSHVGLGEAAILAHLYLEDARGNQRSLIKFSIEDWTEYGQVAATNRAAWDRRKVLAETAISLLKANGVERTENLPHEDMVKLASMAAEAWREK